MSLLARSGLLDWRVSASTGDTPGRKPGRPSRASGAFAKTEPQLASSSLLPGEENPRAGIGDDDGAGNQVHAK